jgi:hypothetical protein
MYKALSLLSVVAATSTMEKDMQDYIDSVNKITGYKISVGYKDETHEFGIGSGPDVSGEDTMLMGSGTKPFTAVSILRLVD